MANKAVKPTKVPVMHDDLAYSDWKKEIGIWEMTNTVLRCTKAVLAGTLFESLVGQARNTVLSELTIAKIACDDGVVNILKTLDEFFLGNTVQTAFEAHDELTKFRRKHNTNVKDFLVEFQLKVNKVKLSGTNLSDGVIAYTLLNCANLSQDKVDMIRATCNTLDFKTVKAQLEKIALDKASPSSKEHVKFSSSSKYESPSASIKVEDVYHHCSQLNNSDSSEGSETECNEGYYGYNNRQRQHNNHGHRGSSKKLNPIDKYGHVTDCDFCKCVYHYINECPYAPDYLKNNSSRKSSNYRNFNSNQKKALMTRYRSQSLSKNRFGNWFRYGY